MKADSNKRTLENNDIISIEYNDQIPDCEDCIAELTLLADEYILPYGENFDIDYSVITATMTDSLGYDPPENTLCAWQAIQQNVDGDWVDVGTIGEYSYFLPTEDENDGEDEMEATTIFDMGDAAGLVDPFTGEGIGNAMVSGRIASEVAAKAKLKNNFTKEYLKRYDQELWGYLGNELSTSTKLLKLAHSKFLLNFVIDRAARNEKVRDIMSGMLAEEIPKSELSNPLFYLKILFS